jgi:hypothetical protein
VELRQLKAFVAVATELHFGRASERLHMTDGRLLSPVAIEPGREAGTALKDAPASAGRAVLGF